MNVKNLEEDIEALQHLTLTRVVFESLAKAPETATLLYLTLTRVVFE